MQHAIRLGLARGRKNFPRQSLECAAVAKEPGFRNDERLYQFLRFQFRCAQVFPVRVGIETADCHPRAQGTLHRNAADAEILATGRAQGMRTLRDDAERWLAAGATSLEEVLRVTGGA